MFGFFRRYICFKIISIFFMYNFYSIYCLNGFKVERISEVINLKNYLWSEFCVFLVVERI